MNQIYYTSWLRDLKYFLDWPWTMQKLQIILKKLILNLWLRWTIGLILTRNVIVRAVPYVKASWAVPIPRLMPILSRAWSSQAAGDPKVTLLTAPTSRRRRRRRWPSPATRRTCYFPFIFERDRSLRRDLYNPKALAGAVFEDIGGEKPPAMSGRLFRRVVQKQEALRLPPGGGDGEESDDSGVDDSGRPAFQNPFDLLNDEVGLLFDCISLIDIWIDVFAFYSVDLWYVNDDGCSHVCVI